jgi:antitoxin (DNA-binding transcriptional repressor) of toxin-antitoxin stability system
MERGWIMATTPNVIDISQRPELRRLVDEVRESGRSVLLRQGNEAVAVITPVEPAETYPWRRPTEDDYAAFRSAAGSWEGHIDVEQFLRDNYESRRLSTRPPVDLGDTDL